MVLNSCLIIFLKNNEIVVDYIFKMFYEAFLTKKYCITLEIFLYCVIFVIFDAILDCMRLQNMHLLFE